MEDTQYNGRSGQISRELLYDLVLTALSVGRVTGQTRYDQMIAVEADIVATRLERKGVLYTEDTPLQLYGKIFCYREAILKTPNAHLKERIGIELPEFEDDTLVDKIFCLEKIVVRSY